MERSILSGETKSRSKTKKTSRSCSSLEDSLRRSIRLLVLKFWMNICLSMNSKLWHASQAASRKNSLSNLKYLSLYLDNRSSKSSRERQQGLEGDSKQHYSWKPCHYLRMIVHSALKYLNITWSNTIESPLRKELSRNNNSYTSTMILTSRMLFTTNRLKRLKFSVSKMLT